EPISGESRSSAARRRTSRKSTGLIPGTVWRSLARSFMSLGVTSAPNRLDQLDQLGLSIGEILRPVRTEVDGVLEPDATPARKIDPRLHGDYGMRRQRRVGHRR